MRVLIITSCTGEKKTAPPNQLKLEDFRSGSAHIALRENELSEHLLPAATIYTGQQHIRLMRGIELVSERIDVDLRILSAGYGLISGNRRIAPYEATFHGMKTRDIREWADRLDVPNEIRKTFSQPFDLCLVLLGQDYLKACNFTEEVKFGGPTLFFCSSSASMKLPKWPNTKVVLLSNNTAKRFSCGLVALKGELGRRVLILLSNGMLSSKFFGDTDVLGALERVHLDISQQGKGGHNWATSEKRHYFTEHIPRRGAQMLYFIPEWDDRVDPEYDFERDLPTASRDPYTHDVYAHEIYERPNYDGILVSRSVIEKNKRKSAKIKSIGIHAHVRVPRSFPIMGDCGAFSYVTEQVPPYSTVGTLEFYENLDFDFGVSVDHIILPEHLQRTIYMYMWNTIPFRTHQHLR